MKSNIAIIGDIGVGKSHVTRTLLAEYPDWEGKVRKGAGLKNVFQVSCEPGWAATNGDLTCEMGFHVHEVLPANPSWRTMEAWLEKISNMSTEAIKKMELPASIRSGYRQFMDLYTACQAFTCIRCKKEFGCIDDYGEDTAFVNDGLTGISRMAAQFTVGPKPTLTWGETDSAQHHVEDYVHKCVALSCTYILVAHWAKEPNQVESGLSITVNTIGQKLAGRIVLDTFDEIILAERNGNTYTWNMNDERVVQKARRLPYKAGLKPDYSQIFAKGV
jgi:hypothetical protein